MTHPAAVPVTDEAIRQALADHAALEATLAALRNRVMVHAARAAALQVLARFPQAAYLVIAPSEDASWDSYAYAALDTDGQIIHEYEDDPYDHPGTTRLNRTVMDLPTGCPAAIADGDYPVIDDAYLINLTQAVGATPA